MTSLSPTPSKRGKKKRMDGADLLAKAQEIQTKRSARAGDGVSATSWGELPVELREMIYATPPWMRTMYRDFVCREWRSAGVLGRRLRLRTLLLATPPRCHERDGRDDDDGHHHQGCLLQGHPRRVGGTDADEPAPVGGRRGADPSTRNRARTSGPPRSGAGSTSGRLYLCERRTRSALRTVGSERVVRGGQGRSPRGRRVGGRARLLHERAHLQARRAQGMPARAALGARTIPELGRRRSMAVQQGRRRRPARDARVVEGPRRGVGRRCVRCSRSRKPAGHPGLAQGQRVPLEDSIPRRALLHDGFIVERAMDNGMPGVSVSHVRMESIRARWAEFAAWMEERRNGRGGSEASWLGAAHQSGWHGFLVAPKNGCHVGCAPIGRRSKNRNADISQPCRHSRKKAHPLFSFLSTNARSRWLQEPVQVGE